MNQKFFEIKYIHKNNTVNNMKLMIHAKVRVIHIGMCLQLTHSKCINSLTAMVSYVRPHKIELRENVVSWSILVRF